MNQITLQLPDSFDDAMRRIDRVNTTGPITAFSRHAFITAVLVELLVAAGQGPASVELLHANAVAAAAGN